MRLYNFTQTTMCSPSKDRYIQGDEYLPDMRLPYEHSQHYQHYSLSQPDDLARELSRLSTGVGSTPHYPGHSRESNLLLQHNRLSQYPESNAGSSTSKHHSKETPASSSTRSSSSFSRTTRRSTDNDRWRHPSTLPSLSMLDQWLGQVRGQDPFHGLVRMTDHRNHSERR